MAEFRVSKEQYVSSMIRMIRWNLILAGALLYFFLAALLIADFKSGQISLSAVAGRLALALSPVALFVAGRTYSGWSYRRFGLHQTFRYAFTNEGFDCRFGDVLMSATWEKIKNWSEDDTSLYLRQKGPQGWIISKAALSSEENELIYRQLQDVKKAR